MATDYQSPSTWNGLYIRIGNGGALDDLTISGFTVPTGPQLAVSYDAATSSLTISRDSQTGKLYDLLASTTLDTPPSTPPWAVYDGNRDIPADVSGTNTLVISKPVDPGAFFAILEKDAPEPVPLETFEGGAIPDGWE